MRFRLPEFFLGSMLTIAVFAMGMVFERTGYKATDPQILKEGEKASDAQKEHGSVWNWLTHDAAGFFTLWLVIVGSGQAGLFVWQLIYMRTGMRDAKAAAEAATLAAEAAKTQAETGKATLQVMQDTAKRQLRAYIFVKNGRVERIFGKKSVLKADLTIENSGQTPAYELTHKTALRIAPYEGANAYSEEGTSTQNLVLASRAETPLNIFGLREFTLEDNTAYMTGAAKILVYGEVAYTDAFGDTQTTEFKFEVTGDVWGSKGHLRPTPDGNTAT